MPQETKRYALDCTNFMGKKGKACIQCLHGILNPQCSNSDYGNNMEKVEFANWQIDIGVCYGKTVDSSMLKQKLPVLVLAGPSCSWLPRGIEHGEGCMQVGDEYIAGTGVVCKRTVKIWKDSVEARRIMVRRQTAKLVSALGCACSKAPQCLTKALLRERGWKKLP